VFAISKSEPRRGIWHRNTVALGAPQPGEIKVEVLAAGICGTDYHIYLWDAWSADRVKPPMVIGHEFVGRVTQIGKGVDNVKVGDRVSAECHITCGTCAHCRTGNAHLCADTSIIGVDRPGAFTQEIAFPAINAWKVPDSIPNAHAAAFDPMGNAMHTVTTAGVTGEDVLVIGAGPIGLFAAAISLAHGARTVTVQEPNQARGAIAESLGVDLVINPLRDDAPERIKQVSNGQGPSVILEFSGNERAIQGALEIARPGAKVALLGIPSGTVTLDLGAKVVMKGLQLLGVTGRQMFKTWYQVESFMLRNPDLMDKIITHQLPAGKYAEGFELMDEGACGKVILDFTNIQEH